MALKTFTLQQIHKSLFLKQFIEDTLIFPDYYRLNPEGNIGLNDQETVTYKFKIDRNADLIHDIYFSFTLPDIYSNNNYDFRWIKNIGFNIIDKVSIYIGGSVIDEH